MIRELSEGHGKILGFIVEGRVSLEEERKWLKRIEEAIEEYGRVRILVVLTEKAGWGVRAGMEDIRWVMAHTGDMERIAVVSDKKVWKWLADIERPAVKAAGIEERYFPTEERDRAWEWLRGE